MSDDDFGFILLDSEHLLELLQRVEAGEPAIDVFAEVSFASDRIDKDGDDE
jgi:hypothetical protein